LDRPVTGIVLFAKTSKALTRLNKMFQDKEIKGSYGARCDCAGYVNQVVYKLKGITGPSPAAGNTINDWLQKGRVP
jgi:23S rRNA-/tRNA-specific pseudouridylate synthase